jgi:hypothetical protein
MSHGWARHLIRNVRLPPPAYSPTFPSSRLSIDSVLYNVSTDKYVVTFAISALVRLT